MTALVLALTLLAADPTSATVAESVSSFLLPDDVLFVQMDLAEIQAIREHIARRAAKGDELRSLDRFLEPLVKTSKALQQRQIRQVFVIYSGQQLIYHDPTVVVLVAGVDASKAVEQVLQPFGVVRTITREGRHAVVLGPPERLAAIVRAGGAWDREQELANALATLDDSSVKAVLLTNDWMRVLREFRPEMPEGIDVTAEQLASMLRSIGIAFWATPDEVSMRLVIQANGEDAARTLHTTLAQFAEWVGPALDLRVGESDENMALVVSWLMPRVEGDRLVKEVPNGLSLLARTELQWLSVLPNRTLRNAQHREQIERLASAALRFESHYGGLPPTASYDEQGKPLLSWRVHLLPFLGEGDLYARFRLNEPWDSPHNRELIAEMPAIYLTRRLERRENGKTGYLAPVGPTCVFHGRTGISMQDISDGPSNTILFVEATPEHAVTWTQPLDWEVDLANPMEVLNGPDDLEFIYCRADMTGHAESTSIDPERMRRLLQRNDGRTLD